ncbi:MAG: hypothetical protein WBK96_10280 [Candidatus Manganitrophaceae bacterium]
MAYDEPYRWVEAIRNRRDYLEEQLVGGSPIVALPFQNGILMATLGGGTQKLYEVYDQIAFGGIGHPADLEKLRNVVLDAAHAEGFNRSPADVTVRRLMKFILAPMVKQAFEEVLHAPYIVKIILAEIPLSPGGPLFFSLNHDGVFQEQERGAVLAPTSDSEEQMRRFLNAAGETTTMPFREAFQTALRTWAVSQIPADPQARPEGHPEDQRESRKESDPPSTMVSVSTSGLRSDLQPFPGGHNHFPEVTELDSLLKKNLETKTIEVVLLDRTRPGTSKYRSLSREEIDEVIVGWLK